MSSADSPLFPAMMQAVRPVRVSVLHSRLGVGEGIWTLERMEQLVDLGYTHIVDLQDDFDDTPLAVKFGVDVLWHPSLDDLEPKTSEFFEVPVRFALAAFAEPGARIYVHCAAGIHRGPLAAAAILCAQGFPVDGALRTITASHPLADFPEVYVDSLRLWLADREATAASC